MNTKDTGSKVGAPLNRRLDGFGTKVLDALRSMLKPAPCTHVGMFAGSLLSHESWSEPKVPR
jgi:hypothetical protein